MPDRMSEYMSERMPDRMLEYMSERMPGRMSDTIPDRLPERMPEYMSDRMSEYIQDMCKIYVLTCHGGDHSKKSNCSWVTWDKTGSWISMDMK